jgi:hypothetical protein
VSLTPARISAVRRPARRRDTSVVAGVYLDY